MPRELKPCGTMAAYMRHRYHGERPCEACVGAWRQYKVARRGGYKSLPSPAPCGTSAAYKRHLDYGEVPCDPCRQAKVKYQRDLRARRAAKQAAA